MFSIVIIFSSALPLLLLKSYLLLLLIIIRVSFTSTGVFLIIFSVSNLAMLLFSNYVCKVMDIFVLSNYVITAMNRRRPLQDYCLFVVEIPLSFTTGRLCVIYPQYRYPAEETCNPKDIKFLLLD